MSRYRRAITGNTFFFTAVAFRRRPIFCDAPIRAALRHAIETVRVSHPFDIDAWVMLPDHMHCIWTMPEDDSDFSSRWMSIKQRVSIACRPSHRSGRALTASGLKHHESTIWQRRYWEHRIRDQLDFERHMDYVHFNPVRHRLVKCVADWPYSTFHRLVRSGVYASDWGGTADLADLDFE